MASLATKDTVYDLKEDLQYLPENINEIYGKALERIRNQDKQMFARAEQILTLINCAMRPLRMDHMLCALAIRPGDQDLNKDALPKASAVLSAFSGLLIIDEESQIVKLVHYTTEEYFQRKGDYRSPEAHRQVTCILITYLNSSTLTDAIFPRTTRIDHNSKVEAYKRAKEEILRQNVLLNYGAKYWGNHVRQALNYVDEVIMGSGLGTQRNTGHFEAKYRSLIWEIDRLFPALLASRSNMAFYTQILRDFEGDSFVFSQ